MWTFLVIQALFIGLIVLYGTESTGPAQATVLQACAHGGWQGLFKSYNDCMVHYAAGLNAAGHVGQGLGIVMVVVAWVITDIILGIGRLVVLTARRRSS
jgi:hypothetical protein